jgi:hypothetical protein
MSLGSLHNPNNTGPESMPYVNRDENGKIIALATKPGEGVTERLSASDPEVLAFLQESESDSLPREFLTSSDLELVRALEDVIDLLVEKKVINFTELPDEVQHKLLNRQYAREKLQDEGSLLIEGKDIL